MTTPPQAPTGADIMAAKWLIDRARADAVRNVLLSVFTVTSWGKSTGDLLEAHVALLRAFDLPTRASQRAAATERLLREIDGLVL